MPIINVRYHTNLTKKGNPSTSKVRRAVYYYGYGVKEENPEQLQRGEWYGPDGWERHGDVINWASGNARQHMYSYKVLLSVRDGKMLDSDFVDAIRKGGVFNDWRLISHADTEHDHAHVLAFRDEKIDRTTFDEWRKKVGAHLEESEALRLQEARQQAESPRLVEQVQQANNMEWEI